MAGIVLNRSRQVPAEETPAFGGIAERFRRAGDLDRAIALCRDGLKRFPDQLSARVTLGWAFLDKGLYDQARAELEQVLRKAPDNLAAIRGLAELHDRTEGALPPEDERAWKSDETSGPAAAAAPAATPAPDRFAPIPVSLSNSPAVVMSTAAYAEQVAEEAALAFDPVVASAGAPVELEAAAAASLAAAEATPFLVGDPVESLAFDPGGAAGEAQTIASSGYSASHEVEVETAGAAVLSSFEPHETASAVAFDPVEVETLTTFALESALDRSIEPAAFDPGVNRSQAERDDQAEIGWEDLAELQLEPLFEAPNNSVDEAAASSVSSSLALEAPTEGADEPPVVPAVSEAMVVESLHQVEQAPAPPVGPERLDDIDEAAGQDLADAIKALEDASRRLSSRLAPRAAGSEPATPAQEIAAFDFGADVPAADDVADGPAAISEGAFELQSPDLSDVGFAVEPALEDRAPHEDDAAGLDLAMARPADEPVFAVPTLEADVVESLPAAISAVVNLAGAFEPGTDLSGPDEQAVPAQAPEIVDDLDAAGATPDDVPDEVVPGGDGELAASSAIDAGSGATAGPDLADAEPPAEAADADQDLPVAAMVAIDDEAARIELGPEIVFRPSYDAPAMRVPVTEDAYGDLTPGAALVDAVASDLGLAPTRKSTRSTLAALERFLHKVQARQLELRGESVA